MTLLQRLVRFGRGGERRGDLQPMPIITRCDMVAYLAWADGTASEVGMPVEVRFEVRQIVAVWAGRFPRTGTWIGFGIRSNLHRLRIEQTGPKQIGIGDTYHFVYTIRVHPDEENPWTLT